MKESVTAALAQAGSSSLPSIRSVPAVRAAREAYAQSRNYDVRAMVADLRARDAAGDWPVVRRTPRRPRLALAPRSVSDQTL